MSDVDPASAVRAIDVSSPSGDHDGEQRRADAADAVQEATADHQAAEGAEASASLSSRDGLQNALLRTQPHTPLEQVESPWDPERGGINRIYRGLQKALDFEGMPAIVDVVVGAAEFVTEFEPAGGSEQNESSGSSPAADEEGIGMELPQ